MSKEALEQFMTQVAGSADPQARIGEEIGADALVALGADHGCEFTVEDVRAAGRAERPGELNDEQLEAVSGGFKSQHEGGAMGFRVSTPGASSFVLCDGSVRAN